MCFSATASFTAAGVLSTIGVLTLRTAPTQQLRHIAVLPLIFAFQQMLEGIVWVTLTSGHSHSLAHTIAVAGFLFFAGIFWPIWIPWVLYRLEQNQGRKRLLQANIWIGMIIGAFSAFIMITTGRYAQIIAHHIAYPLLTGPLEHYIVPYEEMGYLVYLLIYLFVTVGSSFISTIKYIWILGALASIAFIITQIFYAYAFGSVWCFFAAIISMVSYFIIKKSV